MRIQASMSMQLSAAAQGNIPSPMAVGDRIRVRVAAVGSDGSAQLRFADGDTLHAQLAPGTQLFAGQTVELMVSAREGERVVLKVVQDSPAGGKAAQAQWGALVDALMAEGDGAVDAATAQQLKLALVSLGGVPRMAVARRALQILAAHPFATPEAAAFFAQDAVLPTPQVLSAFEALRAQGMPLSDALQTLMDALDIHPQEGLAAPALPDITDDAVQPRDVQIPMPDRDVSAAPAPVQSGNPKAPLPETAAAPAGEPPVLRTLVSPPSAQEDRSQGQILPNADQPGEIVPSTPLPDASVAGGTIAAQGPAQTSPTSAAPLPEASVSDASAMPPEFFMPDIGTGDSTPPAITPSSFTPMPQAGTASKDGLPPSQPEQPPPPVQQTLQNPAAVSATQGSMGAQGSTAVQPPVHTPPQSAQALAQTLLSLFTRVEGEAMPLGIQLRRSAQAFARTAAALPGAELPAEFAPAQQAAQTLSQAADLSAQLQRFAYIPLPILMNNTPGMAELYVMRRGGGRSPIDAQDVTVLLALDTQALGRVESVIRVEGHSIHLCFRVHTEDLGDLLVSQAGPLGEALSRSGYHLAQVKSERIDVPTTPLNAQGVLQQAFGDEPARAGHRIDVTV